jgi:hypothetical protein
VSAKARASGGNAVPEGLDGLAVILADLRDRYRPSFRRGMSIYSETAREVRPAEGCFAPDKVLVAKLAAATDCPRDGSGNPDLKRVPKFYREWVRSAWRQLLTELPEEPDTAEVVESAEEEFRRAVTDGLIEEATFGEKGEEPERRSLIDWAARWAKPGPWKRVRSKLLWCKRDAEGGPPRVAVRVELFGRVRRAGLSEMTHRTFAALCLLYGVGRVEDDQGEGQRAGGQRVVVLTPEFVAEVLRGPGGESPG